MLWNDKRPGGGLTEHSTGVTTGWGGPKPADFDSMSSLGRSHGVTQRATHAELSGHTWGGHAVNTGPRHVLGNEHFR